MFANVFVSSLRASAKMAPRAVPIARAPAARAIPRAFPATRSFSTTVARRNATATKKELDNQVRRGFDEIIPFLKREFNLKGSGIITLTLRRCSRRRLPARRLRVLRVLPRRLLHGQAPHG